MVYHRVDVPPRKDKRPIEVLYLVVVVSKLLSMLVQFENLRCCC